MAEDLGLDKPQDWHTRCHTLYFRTYKQKADACGLALNEQTFRALLDCVVPDAAMRTTYAELPTRFVFNPWLGMGKGGMREVSVSERINSAPLVGI